MKTEKKYFASMMCADYSSLATEIIKLDTAGIDGYHIDVMDGSYVENFGMDPQMVKVIDNLSNKIVDIHLMIDNPERYIDYFKLLQANILQFHPETSKHPLRTVQKIKASNLKVGIVINPSQNIVQWKSLFPYVDVVTLMSVNPGFAGQEFIEESFERVEELIKYKKVHGFKIELDGALSIERIKQFEVKGADYFVLGTSSLFNNSPYETTITLLKNG